MSYPGRVCVGLIGVNCCVFLLWRIPALHGTMARWFLADPNSSESTCEVEHLRTYVLMMCTRIKSK